MTDPSIPEMQTDPKKRSIWRNLSLVWLVPIAALVLSLGLAWQTFSDRGVLIEITFNTASGIAPGETALRHRDVLIGTVEDVRFSDDLSKVVVEARISNDVAPYLDEDTQFWVVRPEISARGITGLDTVLSGVFIESAWDAKQGTPQRSFVGAETPPLAQPGRDGRRITLSASDGRIISEGAPVLFRGIEVGKLERPRLTIKGDTVLVDAFIEAPHDRVLSSATRFWDTSGFSVSFGAEGLTLDVDSITTLLSGGIAFDSVFEGGRPVGPSYVFEIYGSQSAARQSIVLGAAIDTVALEVHFEEPASGLNPGARVELAGLGVGEVSATAVRVTETDAGPTLSLVATLEIDPTLLGLETGSTRDDVFNLIEEAVANGLRARLATSGLLSAALKIELVELEDAPPAVFQRDAVPLPLLPSVDAKLSDFTATAEGVLERINNLPIEELMDQATDLLVSIQRVVNSPETRAVPGQVVGLLEDTRGLVASDEIQSLPADLQGAVADLRAVIGDLRDADAVASLGRALRDAERITENLADASDEVPLLLADIRAVVEKVNALDAQELVTATTDVMTSIDAIIGTEAAQNLPPTLGAALEEIRASLVELREGGAVANVNATLISGREAADAVADAARGLPDLSQRLERVVAQAELLVANYGASSDFSASTLDAIRELRLAARSISDLARAIERSPNSLLFGR